jgi:hypothetical protein
LNNYFEHIRENFLHFALIFTLFTWNLTGFTQAPQMQRLAVSNIEVSGGFGLPLGAFAERVALVYPVGGGFFRQSAKGWQFGGNAHFLFGEEIKEPGFASNLLPLIAGDGSFPGIGATFQGIMAGGFVGKVLPIGKPNGNSGFALRFGGGYLSSWYALRASGGLVPQLAAPYDKGYDRMSTGFYLSQWIGYQLMSNNQSINFYIGIEAVQGLQEHRRGYQYDIGILPSGLRSDLWLGLKAGWFFPLYPRSKREFIEIN